jgi:hypothetical protein
MPTLKQYWGPDREDSFLTGTPDGEQGARDSGYHFVRIEGYSFPSSEPGVVPLRSYFNTGRGDNFTTATSDGNRDAAAAGYLYSRDEGYVLTAEQPGTVPLKLFWHPHRADNLTTATTEGERLALEAGYEFVRVEGHVSPLPTDLAVDLETDMEHTHRMTTHGVMLRSGHVDATTRTLTRTWFGGFHGAVQILFEDAHGITIGATDIYTFGVDGTWIGRSDRTDYWTEEVGTNVAGRTSAIHVLHFWNPIYVAIQNIVREAVNAARPVVDLMNDVKSRGADGK